MLSNIGVGTKFYFPEFLSTSRDINIVKGIAGSETLMNITVQNNGTNGKKYIVETLNIFLTILIKRKYYLLHIANLELLK